MQVTPGMTQDQRKAAGDSYRQFQQRLLGNRQQTSSAPVIGNAPNGRPVTGAITTAQPTKAPDMSAYAPQGGFEAYRPSQAQPKTTSQGTPYGQPAAPKHGFVDENGKRWRHSPNDYLLWGGKEGYDKAVAEKFGSRGQPQSPAQQPSQGTPYDDARDGMVPGQPRQPAPQPSFDWRSYFNQTPMVRESYEERFTPAPPPPAPAPPKFTSEFTQSMTGFGGRQSDPKQFYAQRDAFIQRLNEERGRQAAQAGVYGTGETPQFYRPSRDFGVLWGQAGDMVSNGWTNPLAGLFG